MSKKHFFPADILLPKSDFESWSCIACDQYTSEPEYWQETARITAGKNSAFHIVLPEVYLTQDNSEKISKINENMNKYITEHIFNVFENSVFYIERTLKNGKIRKGLVGLIDLEDYSYVKGEKTTIRATEQTVLERIPPRVEIRKDAPLELPHVMLLIDDPNDTVIAPISRLSESLSKVYDFTLMQNAGHLKGYKLENEQIENLQNALETLKSASKDGLLFAVGDGNHSLATAKECYSKGSGSRYALAEIVNIHDCSLEFEPIYRIAFTDDPQKLLNAFIDYQGGIYKGQGAQSFTCIIGECKTEISVKPSGKLAVATLQNFLDKYISENPSVKIDYIHGIESTENLAKTHKNSIAFIFNGMEKSELFPAVSADGSLPRKTFSMGCADDKRFYLEARKI